eukprot:g26770.t1
MHSANAHTQALYRQAVTGRSKLVLLHCCVCVGECRELASHPLWTILPSIVHLSTVSSLRFKSSTPPNLPYQRQAKTHASSPYETDTKNSSSS